MVTRPEKPWPGAGADFTYVCLLQKLCKAWSSGTNTGPGCHIPLLSGLNFPLFVTHVHRLCRPGSIVGPQQQYLASIEARMFREGMEYRLRHRLPNPAGSDEVSAFLAVEVENKII